MKRPSHLLFVLVAAVGVIAAGCASSTTGAPSAGRGVATTTAGTPSSGRTTTAGSTQGTLTVFAAASLTAAFHDLGTVFTKANPQAKVSFSYDASSALVQQIIEGAPADVFASADQVNMDKL